MDFNVDDWSSPRYKNGLYLVIEELNWNLMTILYSNKTKVPL
jgi:hypothetical protein